MDFFTDNRNWFLLSSLLFLLTVWISCFIRLFIQRDEENSLSKKYGTGKKGIRKKKRDIMVLVLSGLLVAAMIVIYVYVL